MGQILSLDTTFPIPEESEISLEVFPDDFNFEGVLDNSIFVFPDDLEYEGVVTTPNGIGTSDDLIDGSFSFPDKDVIKGSYILDAAGEFGRQLGLAREQEVARIVSGTLAKDINGQDITLFEPGASKAVSIDVFGPNGELILVGGPAKNQSNLSQFGRTLSNLKIIAEAKGVKAQHYFTEDTPQSIIDFTIKRLGAENVFTFPDVNLEQP